MAELPKVIAESEMDLLGMKVKVLVLDNGQRVIEKGDAERLFRAMGMLEGELPAEAWAGSESRCFAPSVWISTEVASIFIGTVMHTSVPLPGSLRIESSP